MSVIRYGPPCSRFPYKLTYLTKGDAKATKRRMRARNQLSHDVWAFRCEVCGYHHLGAKKTVKGELSREAHRLFHDRRDSFDEQSKHIGD